MFHGVKHSPVYQEVVAQIEEAILSRSLKAGDRLPSERRMTEVFGTSRRTLREAMRVLEQKGLVEIRTGSKGGAYVTDHSSDRMKESLLILIRQKDISYESLVEFRSELEGATAALAAQRATANDIAALKSLMAETRLTTEDGLAASDRFNDHETSLHLFLGQMCKNPVYEAILRMIHEVLVFPSFKFLTVDEDYIREAYRDWSQLMAAIQKRQPQRARTLMQSHLEKFSRYHHTGGEYFDGENWQIGANTSRSRRTGLEGRKAPAAGGVSGRKAP